MLKFTQIDVPINSWFHIPGPVVKGRPSCSKGPWLWTPFLARTVTAVTSPGRLTHGCHPTGVIGYLMAFNGGLMAYYGGLMGYLMVFFFGI